MHTSLPDANNRITVFGSTMRCMSPGNCSGSYILRGNTLAAFSKCILPPRFMAARVRFYSECCSRSMYEPEQFPGLIHRMVDPKTVILLFASGKLVCTGAKKESDVYRSINNLHAMLEEKDLMVYE